MNDGNWIPIDKNLIKRKKPGEVYTEIEAVFSMQLDLDNHNELKSRNSYAVLWGWSRGKVDRLISDLGEGKEQKQSLNRPFIRLIIKNLQKPTVRKQSSNRPSKSNNGKTKYSEYVSMLPDEYLKLTEQHGEDFTKACILRLNNYKGANGKTYKSDYLAILNWVIQREKQTGEWEDASTEKEG